MRRTRPPPVATNRALVSAGRIGSGGRCHWHSGGTGPRSRSCCVRHRQDHGRSPVAVVANAEVQAGHARPTLRGLGGNVHSIRFHHKFFGCVVPRTEAEHEGFVAGTNDHCRFRCRRSRRESRQWQTGDESQEEERMMFHRAVLSWRLQRRRSRRFWRRASRRHHHLMLEGNTQVPAHGRGTRGTYCWSTAGRKTSHNGSRVQVAAQTMRNRPGPFFLGGRHVREIGQRKRQHPRGRGEKDTLNQGTSQEQKQALTPAPGFPILPPIELGPPS